MLRTYKEDRSKDERFFCANCGKRRYESLLTVMPLPNKGSGKSYFCRGAWTQSRCEEAGIKRLLERRKQLIAETKTITAAFKKLRQLEIR